MEGRARGCDAQQRGSLDGYEIALEGPIEPGEADDELRAFTAAGATWWIHSDWESFDPADARRRIEAGPPRF